MHTAQASHTPTAANRASKPTRRVTHAERTLRAAAKLHGYYVHYRKHGALHCIVLTRLPGEYYRLMWRGSLHIDKLLQRTHTALPFDVSTSIISYLRGTGLTHV